MKQTDAEWASSIVEVDLKRQGLRRLQGLEQLTNLRKACFADNELSLVQDLSACTALQDLSLQVIPVSCVHSRALIQHQTAQQQALDFLNQTLCAYPVT